MAVSDVLAGDHTLVGSEDVAAIAGKREITGNLTIRATELVDLEGLENLITVGGNVYIQQNESLLDVHGLRGLVHVGGFLDVHLNTALLELTLDGLESVEGYVFVSGNKALVNAQLRGLQSVGGDLLIQHNYALAEVGDFKTLATVAGDFRIEGNKALCKCFVKPIRKGTKVSGKYAARGNARGCVCANNPDGPPRPKVRTPTGFSGRGAVSRLRRVPPATFEAIKDSPAALKALKKSREGFDPEHAWDGLLWLISEERRERPYMMPDGDTPQMWALLPCWRLDAVDDASFLSPVDVADVAAALAAIDGAALRAHFDVEAMQVAKVYPDFYWTYDPPEIVWLYLEEKFARLRAFWAEAAGAGNAVISFL